MAAQLIGADLAKYISDWPATTAEYAENLKDHSGVTFESATSSEKKWLAKRSTLDPFPPQQEAPHRKSRELQCWRRLLAAPRLSTWALGQELFTVQSWLASGLAFFSKFLNMVFLCILGISADVILRCLRAVGILRVLARYFAFALFVFRHL